MGQGWATEEETEFLQGYMPQYELCQVKRNYQAFWPRVFSGYQAQFPLLDKIWPNLGKTLEMLTEEESELYNKKLKSRQEVSPRDGFRQNCPDGLSEPQRMVQVAREPS